MLFTPGITEVTPEDIGYDESRLEVLKAHFQGLIDDGTIHCASYCMTRHGKVFAHGAIGKKNYQPEDTTPLSPTDIRWYASITKVIAATAMMKLVEDGLTRLNVCVGEILPQFNTPPFDKITLFHLLTHTSGLHADPGCFPNKYQTNYWDYISHALDKHEDSEETFDWIGAALTTIGTGVRTQPEEEWAYCSFGFKVLGEVIEVLTGIHANDYITRNIFQPIGMKDSFFPPFRPGQAKRMIITDESFEKEMQSVMDGTYMLSKWDRLNLPGTSGGAFGTVYDLTLFGNMFLSKGVANGNRILGRKAVEFMTRKHIHELPNYCWGAEGTGRSYCIGFDLKIDEPFLTSPATYCHEGAGACALHVDPEEGMVAAWFVPFTGSVDWDHKPLYNALNIMWSGIK